MTKQAVLFWSGGKDCMSALHKVQQSGETQIAYLLTTYDQRSERVPFHGIHIGLIEAQAKTLRIPLIKVPLPSDASNKDYEEIITKTLLSLKQKGVKSVVHGDLFLEDLRSYKENLIQPTGLEILFPLWEESSRDLAELFIEQGYKAIICGIDIQRIDIADLGYVYNRPFLKRYLHTIDPCGENGEFHTFVYDGPMFSEPVQYIRNDNVHTLYERYKYLELNHKP